jgi:hypothetical protein
MFYETPSVSLGMPRQLFGDQRTLFLLRSLNNRPPGMRFAQRFSRYGVGR